MSFHADGKEAAPAGPTEFAVPVPNGRVAALISKAKSYTKTRQKRRETLSQAGERDNTWVLVSFFGFIVIPPALILAFASASGFMDQLYTGYRY